MSVIDIFQIIGGVAIFLFGMNLMGGGLERISGGKLEALLKKATGNIFKGILLGALVTAIIQSSSATTVIVVGFVNSGLMTLHQAIGVCLGANIGTTVTAWIISLAGISSDNLILSMFKPINIAAVCALVGIILFMFLKNEKRKEIGYMLLGFAVLMYGLDIMSSTVKVLADTPGFQSALVFFENPIFGFLTGLILTAIIQSSSASLGMLQAIAMGTAAVAGKEITFAIAIPLILGMNVGTCITAVIASVGAKKNALRTALANVVFNLFGAIIFLAALIVLNNVLGLAFFKNRINTTEIAIFHTLFNLASVILFLPFIKYIEKLLNRLIKDDAIEEGKKIPVLDERLIMTPSIALSQCYSAISAMSKKAIENFNKALGLLKNYSSAEYKEILENEDIIDLTEDALGTYLIKITDKDLSVEESRAVSVLLHSIADYERIGDHAMNIADKAKALNKRGLGFSDIAYREIGAMKDAVNDIMVMTSNSFIDKDPVGAAEVEPLEEAIDNITTIFKDKHIKRLQSGDCTIDSGVIYLDLINDFERIADHCSNLAIYVIEIREAKLDAHEYIKVLKQGSDEFLEKSNEYSEKYLARLD